MSDSRKKFEEMKEDKFPESLMWQIKRGRIIPYTKLQGTGMKEKDSVVSITPNINTTSAGNNLSFDYKMVENEELPKFKLPSEEQLKESLDKWFKKLIGQGKLIEIDKNGKETVKNSLAHKITNAKINYEDNKDNWRDHLSKKFREAGEKRGKKESEGKLSMELDWSFIKQMAERTSQNKDKYEPYNWQKPMDTQKLKDSLMRHVLEVMEGNYNDDGREFGHLEAIALNAQFINYQLKNNKK